MINEHLSFDDSENIVKNFQDLEGRLNDLLRIPSSAVLFLQSMGSVALVGGAIRDVALGGISSFRSDFDFVIYDCDTEDFRRKMNDIHSTPNRFGGFKIHGFSADVDVWHLEDTWANRQGLVKVNGVEDILKCTFFNWDAVVFDIRNRKIHSSFDYIDVLRSRVLDINLEENPNKAGALVRAIRRAVCWNALFGPKLTRFALECLCSMRWDDLVDLDRKSYPSEAVLCLLSAEKIIENLMKNVEGQPGVTRPVHGL